MLLALGVGLFACDASPDPDPLATALDRDESVTRRVHAIGQITDDETGSLYALIWSSGHRIEVREATVDRLRAADPAFWPNIERGILRVDDWSMIRLLCERAMEDNNIAFLPAAIKSWARPSTTIDDMDRPEREVVLYFARGLPETAWLREALDVDTSAGAQGQMLQVAAWTVLMRLYDDQALREIIEQRPHDNAFLEPLALVTAAVHRLPADAEELARLETLVTGSTAEQWQLRYAYCAAQTDLGNKSVALRHMPSIDRAGFILQEPSEALLDALRGRLAQAKHAYRGDRAEGEYAEPRPERLADHAAKLSHADLIVLLQIHDALHRPDVAAQLFRQADGDRADTSTEWGGVLVWDQDSQPMARHYPPMLRRHDRMYIASDACVRAMHTGLAHYHFHVQEPDSAVWAGPGQGDLGFADRMHANCVVLTSLDVDTLNADAYFPGGIIVDLGCITRP